MSHHQQNQQPSSSSSPSMMMEMGSSQNNNQQHHQQPHEIPYLPFKPQQQYENNTAHSSSSGALTSPPPLIVSPSLIRVPSMENDSSQTIIVDSNHQKENVVVVSMNGSPHQQALNHTSSIIDNNDQMNNSSDAAQTPSPPSSQQGEERKDLAAADEDEKYKLHINDWDANSKETKKWYLGIKRPRFPSNYISTTKYTWWNFLILNPLLQMKKIGNIYFIIVMIFALVPGVSPTNPVTSVLPVIFILGVNMVREGGEDFLRYLSDRKVNKMSAYVLKENEFQRVDTCDVRVGDIVKVSEDYSFPADILLITSNLEDGSCNIETANLDGETNLKTRNCPKGLHAFNTPEKLSSMKGIIDCQPPNEELYKFKGSIKVEGMGPEIPLSHANLLLKGSILRSTQYIYGIVIYTGPDTKIMKNMQKAKVKFSFVNKMLNYFIGALFVLQIIFCLIFVGLGGYEEFVNACRYAYTGKSKIETTDAGYVVLSILTYFILLNLLIPVSLFVSLEFVKMIQAWFITMDNQMAIYDTHPHDPDKKVFMNSVSISSDLNADLSQIDIIFSDKTGTLTENSMVFNKCCIGNDYIHDDYQTKGHIGRVLNQLKDYHLMKKHGVQWVTMNEHGESLNNMIFQLPQPEIDSIISNRKLSISSENEFFLGMNTLLLLSLCHNVAVREKPLHGSDPSSTTTTSTATRKFFEGESVDEVALVLGAVNNDFVLKSFSEKRTVVSIFGKDYTFERLCEIPFTPDRKRMSTFFKIPQDFLNDFPVFKKIAQQQHHLSDSDINHPEGMIVCYTKGADSFLFPFIDPSNSKLLKPKLDEHILDFAKDGLRTLLLAYKFIGHDEFNEWITRYNAAKSLLTKTRDQAIEQAEKEIEKNLLITGASGIEDKLQPKVPETIRFFLQAGLQLWLLTGDKRETAVNIATMSNFLDEDSQIFTLDGDPESRIPDSDRYTKVVNDQVCAKGIETYLNSISKLDSFQSKQVALVIDGHAFTHCMEPLSQKFFIKLIKKCKTVICCRATPKQKSMLVDLAKKKLGKNGLAIGDGANDVPMIQKAKVGVGVMGKEGSQAKLASDYAIPKFYMLKRLLVIHGRYSFKRSAQFIQYSFYKNIVITFIQIYFTFYTMYSGQTIIDSYVLTFYNLLFTLLNPFVFGLMEKDIHEEYLEDAEIGPTLYSNLRKENIFNWYTFIKWILGAVVHATIIFFFALYARQFNILTNGQEDGIWVMSILVTSSVFCVVNLKCYFEMEHFTIVHHLCMAFSFLTFYVFNFSYSGIPMVLTTSNMYYVWYMAVQSAKFWIIHILLVVTPLAFDLLFYGVKYLVYPDYYQILKMTTDRKTFFKNRENASNKKNESAAAVNEPWKGNHDIQTELQSIGHNNSY